MTRLIDADALKRELEVTQYNDIDDLTRTEKLIDNAPTSFFDWEKSDAYLDCVKRIISLKKENEELRQFLKMQGGMQ